MSPSSPPGFRCVFRVIGDSLCRLDGHGGCSALSRDRRACHRWEEDDLRLVPSGFVETRFERLSGRVLRERIEHVGKHELVAKEKQDQ